MKQEEFDEAELEDPATWDFERAERTSAAAGAGAVVPVRFPGADFELVARCAERSGRRLADFIRDAAIDRARREKLD